jgi:hypothetical protein
MGNKSSQPTGLSVDFHLMVSTGEIQDTKIFWMVLADSGKHFPYIWDGP